MIVHAIFVLFVCKTNNRNIFKICNEHYKSSKHYIIRHCYNVYIITIMCLSFSSAVWNGLNSARVKHEKNASFTREKVI